MMDWTQRVAATQATENRFRDRPFDWGKAATCVHLLRYHASKMGHALPIVPRFRGPVGARKALLAMGHADLPELMDSLFPRIPAAFSWVGDVMAAPGEGGFHGLMIKGEGNYYLGWHEESKGCTIINVDVTQAVGVWRL